MAAGLLFGCAPARAHYTELASADGTRVSMEIQVEGQTARLYRAPNRPDRYYLEAKEGANYEITLSNRSGERLGAVIDVDGLNVISGDVEVRRSSHRPGRMYVLDPWSSVNVRGWRTSLSDIRRFVFVDERVSYAARSGKANSKMGWIEVQVYRERHRPQPPIWGERRLDEDARDRSEAAPSAKGNSQAESASRQDSHKPSAPAGSFPGTGWGAHDDDQAVLVDFEPESYPSETLNLRYEYRSTLRAMGILPAPPHRDRLWEREHARDGFVAPPNW
jgi:hypothetical protein